MIKIIILSCVIFTASQCRDNPFLPTQDYKNHIKGQKKLQALAVSNANLQIAKSKIETASTENNLTTTSISSVLLNQYQITEFIALQVYSNKLILASLSDKNYIIKNSNLIHKYRIDDKNKFVFDFYSENFGKKSFKIDLKNDIFQSISIGNHQKESFIRVVIQSKFELDNINLVFLDENTISLIFDNKK